MIVAFVVFILMGVLLVGRPSFGAGVFPIAEPQFAPTSVVFQPNIHAELWVLTVSGPGDTYIHREFFAGEPMSIDLLTKEGHPLPDGQYSYELRPHLGGQAGVAIDEPGRLEGTSESHAAVVNLPLLIGTFRILKGSVQLRQEVPRDPPEEAPADQRGATKAHYNENVSIDGTLCVGTSCSSGEVPVSPNQIRIDSDRPGIEFSDTGDAPVKGAGYEKGAGYDHDWEIQINETWYGGSQHFAVRDLSAGTTPFKVRGLAPDNSLYVDPEGRIGLLTSTPAAELHLQGLTQVFCTPQCTSWRSPTIRFSTFEFHPQFPQTREWNLYAGTGGLGVSDQSEGTVPFNIESKTPTNTLFLAREGRVGIGTATPAVTLHVMGETIIEGDFSVLSSRRAKEILSPVSASEVLAALEELPILTWIYKGNSEGAVHLGPTSEAFHAAFGLGPDSKHLSLVDTAGVAMASIQELARLVEAQRREIAELRSERQDLIRRVERLESSEGLSP